MAKVTQPQGIALPVDIFRTILDAAEKHSEDLSSGLDDGTYEEGDDELAELEKAIAYCQKALKSREEYEYLGGGQYRRRD